MRSKTSLIAITVLTAVLLAIGGLLPAMAQATGVITVNKTYVSPTGSFVVTVEDADLNTVTAAKQDVTFTGNGALATQTVTITGLGGGEISGTPVVLDNNGVNTKADGTTLTANTTDVTENTNFKVTVFDAAAGTVIVQTFADVDGAAGDGSTTNDVVSYPITISFNKATTQTTTVKVTSPSDPTTGITVTLTEGTSVTATSANSSKFFGTVNVGAGTSSGTTIQSVAGQVITIAYTDANPSGTRSTTITVESTKPVVTLVSPAHKSFTTSLTPKLTVDITDSDSGVSTTSGDIVFNIVSAKNQADSDVTITGNTTISTSTITNGFRAEVTLSGPLASTTVKITWNATAKDKAGNQGQTDSDAATSDNQDNILIVDNQAPNYATASAFAGRWWDTAKTGTDKTESTATKSKNTFIAVVFPLIVDLTGTTNDEKEQIDGTTVAKTDFRIDTLKKADGTTVSTVTPDDAVVYSGAKNTIFLTVPAMAADAKPVVVLIAGISDVIGNTVSAGSITSGDAQAPAITLISAARQLAKTSAKVSFSSNELLGATPTVTENGNNVTNVTLTGTNQYEATISGAGIHAIEITASDGTNSRTIGEALITGGALTTGFPSSKAIVVDIDSALPLPAFTPADTTSAETAEPFFITIAFTDEAKEYGLATNGTTMTATLADVVTDLDVNAKVTLTKLTLDTVDVLAQVTTTDNNVYTLAIPGIATGSHTLVVNGTDEAGNVLSSDKTITFTITARTAYSLALTAGWNLVSLPGNPVDGALATVFSSSRITQVLTYDPKDANGPWLLATRAADGKWSAASTIKTIDSLHAYWVNTTGGETVKSLLKLIAAGTGDTPPTVSVAAGWNLLPVIDLRQRATGIGIDSAAYFTSISWKVAYKYDPSDTATNDGDDVGPWVRVLPSTTAAPTSVKIGKGYWVWATAAGTLVP